MNEVVEISIRTMEKQLPEAAGVATFVKCRNGYISDVGFYYNPKKGTVIHIVNLGETINPDRSYDSWMLQIPSEKVLEGKYRIADYEPPEDATDEAKSNLAEIVRVWNERHAGLD